MTLLVWQIKQIGTGKCSTDQVSTQMIWNISQMCTKLGRPKSS